MNYGLALTKADAVVDQIEELSEDDDEKLRAAMSVLIAVALVKAVDEHMQSLVFLREALRDDE